MSRVPVRFLVRIRVAVGVKVARKSDRHAAARARKGKVRPDAGALLAAGDFDAAGHGPLGEVRKGSQVGLAHGAELHSRVSSAGGEAQGKGDVQWSL
jgi:hypothetical protein